MPAPELYQWGEVRRSVEDTPPIARIQHQVIQQSTAWYLGQRKFVKCTDQLQCKLSPNSYQCN